uniref:protein FAM177A1 isoform X1 n=2 Tax=Myxine glutinosa TaxID=7769 RepID=UPI00358EFAE7
MASSAVGLRVQKPHQETIMDVEKLEMENAPRQDRVPRRVIHFVSGETMEEYSTDDEEEEEERKDLLPKIDLSKLTWGPYLWFQVMRTSTGTLAVCDFVGERLANFFGVTSAKYQYALDEYYRSKEEEEADELENKMSREAERRHAERQQVDTTTEQPVASGQSYQAEPSRIEVILPSKEEPVALTVV